MPPSKLLAALAAALLAACATTKTEPPPVEAVEVRSTGQPGEALGTRTTRIAATVKAIDAAKRTLTIAGADGQAETLRVPPEVKRFGEIAVGDRIVVELNQGLLLQFQAPGTPGVEPAAAVVGAVADASSAPGGAVAGGVQGTVTVVDVNAGTRVVTFQDPGGNKYRVKAGPGLAIEKLKVGDRLLATYVQAVAVTLEKKPAKK